MEPGSAQGIEARIAVTADRAAGTDPESAKRIIDGIGAVAGDPEYADRIGGDGVVPRHPDLEPELVDPRIVDLALGRRTDMPDAHGGDGSVLGTLN